MVTNIIIDFISDTSDEKNVIDLHCNAKKLQNPLFSELKRKKFKDKIKK